MRFEGKTALVVGGTLGIGRAAAERLAREGATVITGGREPEAGLAGDVRDEGYAQALVERCGTLDVLVYTAGVQRYGTVETTAPETWDEVFGVNVRGAYLVARAAVPALRERGGGAIVIVSSVQATASQTGVAAYTASKGALSALVRAMALDHVRDGIRVNAVAPGSVDTPMLRWAAERFRGDGSAEDQVAAWGRMHPLGRVASADEVAAAIAYLASDDASAITGAELRVDGGLLAGLSVELPE
ncbi:SDR family NAD(P)-dependent oxidoreductase [Candidatus Solirubrobacter pratensis]|uniref:SDR family NAD(P)-dependent oxidoreductase n=1 Tax=Candidatus Solirubrobacter pratensis TaxID=1298857 RepID=UPI000427EA8E|nr:SDR family oxidoreductase [Candidatus Solirubrobacter pratensis]